MLLRLWFVIGLGRQAGSINSTHHDEDLHHQSDEVFLLLANVQRRHLTINSFSISFEYTFPRVDVFKLKLLLSVRQQAKQASKQAQHDGSALIH